MLSHKHSFNLVFGNEAKKASTKKLVTPDLAQPVNDEKRRLFLKTIGVVGAGVAAASILPKKADALVMGGTPATSVVGIKNDANVRINPATESTATSIKVAVEGTQTVTGTINTNIGTLVTNSNKFQFDGGNLRTVATGVAGVVGIKDDHNVAVSPATDDAVVLLRRMVKLMESQATVDQYNRQRISVDAWGPGIQIGTGTSANCPRVAIGSDSLNVGTIGSYTAQQMYGDVAHGVYANALRRYLTFTSSV